MPLFDWYHYGCSDENEYDLILVQHASRVDELVAIAAAEQLLPFASWVSSQPKEVLWKTRHRDYCRRFIKEYGGTEIVLHLHKYGFKHLLKEDLRQAGETLPSVVSDQFGLTSVINFLNEVDEEQRREDEEYKRNSGRLFKR